MLCAEMDWLTKFGALGGILVVVYLFLRFEAARQKSAEDKMSEISASCHAAHKAAQDSFERVLKQVVEANAREHALIIGSLNELTTGVGKIEVILRSDDKGSKQ